MLNGIARLVYTFGDALKDETFKEKVGEMSVKLLSRTAKERRPGSMGYAEAMLWPITANANIRSNGPSSTRRMWGTMKDWTLIRIWTRMRGDSFEGAAKE